MTLLDHTPVAAFTLVGLLGYWRAWRLKRIADKLTAELNMRLVVSMVSIAPEDLINNLTLDDRVALFNALVLRLASHDPSDERKPVA